MKAKYGRRPATFTHDELVYVCKTFEAPRLLHVLIETMRTAPSWAVGLPLDAEGGIGPTYGSAK